MTAAFPRITRQAFVSRFNDPQVVLHADSLLFAVGVCGCDHGSPYVGLRSAITGCRPRRSSDDEPGGVPVRRQQHRARDVRSEDSNIHEFVAPYTKLIDGGGTDPDPGRPGGTVVIGGPVIR